MENNDVQIGMLTQETTFSRERKEIPIGDAGVLDWADFKDGVIHEVKKNKSISAADKAQVSYYMFILNQNGVRIREAVLHYPLLRKTEHVFWTEDLEEKVDKDCIMAEDICSKTIPPPVMESGICKKCAYQEVCFS